MSDAGVVPGGHTQWTTYGTGAYRATESHLVFIGKYQRPNGQVPVVFFHGFLGDADSQLAPTWVDDLAAVAGTGFPVLTSDAGGGSTWGIDDVVAASGAADDVIAWAAADPKIGTRSDKVALWGESMGALNALGWAWRNPGKVRAIVLRSPVVALDAFHDRNAAVFGAAIEAAYGGLAAYTAALPTHDPMENIDLIAPFGDRIQIWYATSDEYIPPEEIEAFAELVGAEAIEMPGTHASTVASPVDRPSMFLVEQIRRRDRAVVEWNENDWDRFRQINATLPVSPSARNTNTRETVVGVGGRRGQFTRVSGTEPNERFGYLLTELLTADQRVETVWHNGDGGAMTGQQGNVMRGQIDEAAGTWVFYTAWSNIFFGIPWIVNRGVWSGNVDGTGFTLLASVNSVIPGIRLAAGGEVLASSRAGGIVTLVVRAEDLTKYRSGVIDVVMAGPLGNFAGTATISGPNHLSYAQAGADVTSGGPGSWADFASAFPYHAETELRGEPAVMRARFWTLGMDKPEFGDPDWSFEWTDAGAVGPDGFGHPGILVGHVGIGSPTVPDVRVQFGLTFADEL